MYGRGINLVNQMVQCSWFLFYSSLFVLSLFVQGCTSLPPRPEIILEHALPPAASGRLAELSCRFREKNGADASGFSLLIDSREALNTRLALIDLATRSIDIQSFIWKGDASGTLLFNRLLQAADRGVKVRIIIDDIWLGSSTSDLLALNAHPNLEIRVFNPNPSRDNAIGSVFNFLASFKELNHRMHNKLMIVDNHVLIAGGRNIGDEYFGLGKKFNFLDIDVVTVGGVLKESSRAFDDYWNTDAAYPVAAFKELLPGNTLEQMRKEVSLALHNHTSSLISYPVFEADWESLILSLEKELIVGTAHFLQDDPVQINGQDYRLVDMIAYIADPTQEEFILATPYLIPVGKFIQDVKRESENNVQVRILTNSLASTNHALVNSHYKKYRRQLLEAGAGIHEFHHQPSNKIRSLVDVDPVVAPFVSLHAKVIVSDRRKCFIGSLNFDPRALVINSENGLLIESPDLAQQLAGFLDQVMEQRNSWQVSINDQNMMQWQSGENTLSAQPSRGFLQSFADFWGRFLPIESQL